MAVNSLFRLFTRVPPSRWLGLLCLQISVEAKCSECGEERLWERSAWAVGSARSCNVV